MSRSFEILPAPHALLIASIALLWQSPSSFSCSRAVYFGLDEQVVTGRTMDWKEDLQSNLWIFPRGMARDGVRNLIGRAAIAGDQTDNFRSAEPFKFMAP